MLKRIGLDIWERVFVSKKSTLLGIVLGLLVEAGMVAAKQLDQLVYSGFIQT